MTYTLIVEKKRSNNTDELMEVLQENAILGLFAGKRISEILNAYLANKNDIRAIIFHASGRDGVEPNEASDLLEEILEWKNNETLLFAVSEGSDHQTEMEKMIYAKRAERSYVDSYTSYVRAFKEKLNEVKRGAE